MNREKLFQRHSLLLSMILQREREETGRSAPHWFHHYDAVMSKKFSPSKQLIWLLYHPQAWVFVTTSLKRSSLACWGEELLSEVNITYIFVCTIQKLESKLLFSHPWKIVLFWPSLFTCLGTWPFPNGRFPPNNWMSNNCIFLNEETYKRQACVQTAAFSYPMTGRKPWSQHHRGWYNSWAWHLLPRVH